MAHIKSISLQPNVQLTSNQAVFLSLSVVLRSIKRLINLGVGGTWRSFVGKGTPKSALQGEF